MFNLLYLRLLINKLDLLSFEAERKYLAFKSIIGIHHHAETINQKQKGSVPEYFMCCWGKHEETNFSSFFLSAKGNGAI